jgi:hypothetical protein
METKKLKIMNYELSENEKKSLNDGSIVSVACYNAKDAAMVDFITKLLHLKHKVVESESPSRRQIFIFFLCFDTFREAFRAGEMIKSKDLYKDESAPFVNTWKRKFSSIYDGFFNGEN